jgi:hypothetical protein
MGPRRADSASASLRRSRHRHRPSESECWIPMEARARLRAGEDCRCSSNSAVSASAHRLPHRLCHRERRRRQLRLAGQRTAASARARIAPSCCMNEDGRERPNARPPDRPRTARCGCARRRAPGGLVGSPSALRCGCACGSDVGAARSDTPRRSLLARKGQRLPLLIVSFSANAPVSGTPGRRGLTTCRSCRWKPPPGPSSLAA